MKIRKILTLVVLNTIGQTLFVQNTGIGTQTPLKKLHVNGDLQVTGEVNTKGSSDKDGNPGSTGQVLMSNGKGNTLSGFTFDILQAAADNSYKLTKIYKINLDKAELQHTSDQYFFPIIDFLINKANNYLLVSYQSATTIVTNTEILDSTIAYAYKLLTDKNVAKISPYA